MQGKSSGFTKHALPGMRKQRILVTFAKSQLRKFGTSDRLPSTWSPPQSKSPNHISHSVPKHYPTNAATSVLPAPAVRPPVNNVRPLFVPAPVAAAMPFPAPVPVPPVSTGWRTPPPPRHSAPPHAHVPVPVPGTGVFLPPPGSAGNASSPPELPLNATEANFPPEKENGPGKSSHSTTSTSPKEKLDVKSHKHDCNGILDGRGMTEDEQQRSIDNTPSN